MNFEINFTFLIKLFFYMIKKPRQNFKYLQNEETFEDEKAFFIIFKGPSVAKNCHRPKSAPLSFNKRAT